MRLTNKKGLVVVSAIALVALSTTSLGLAAQQSSINNLFGPDTTFQPGVAYCNICVSATPRCNVSFPGTPRVGSGYLFGLTYKVTPGKSALAKLSSQSFMDYIRANTDIKHKVVNHGYTPDGVQSPRTHYGYDKKPNGLYYAMTLMVKHCKKLHCSSWTQWYGYMTCVTVDNTDTPVDRTDTLLPRKQ